MDVRVIDLGDLTSLVDKLIGKDVIVYGALNECCSQIVEVSQVSMKSGEVAVRNGVDLDLGKLEDANVALVDAAEKLFLCAPDTNQKTRELAVEILQRVRVEIEERFVSMRRTRLAYEDEQEKSESVVRPAAEWSYRSGAEGAEPVGEDTSDVPLG